MAFSFLRSGFALFLAFGLFFGVTASPVRADAPSAVQNFTTRMIEINALPPLQNPQFSKASDFTGRRITDKTNRVIGSTTDLLVGQDGQVETIVATLDQVGIGAQTLFFDTATLPVTAKADSYALPFHRDDIRKNLPDLLAGISTAAGNDGSFSVVKMAGAAFSGSDGTRIGTIETALFNDSARQIVALAVRNIPGANGHVVAVPYDRTFSIESDFGALRVVAPADFAAAVSDYARKVK